MDNFGQLFVTGIKGTTLSSEEKEFIQNEKIGGIVLASQNFDDPAQLAELVNSIQKLRDEYPLFISVSQEGGKGNVFTKHFTQFPTTLELARLDSPKMVFEVHQMMAREMAACGINLSYSPSCDILNHPDHPLIGERAYGRDAETVEKFISAAIRGLQTCGLLSCAKHFPGQGAQVKTSLSELKQQEMIPFVKASKSRVEFMMMGHLKVDALDEKLPTSLSPKAYEFLRQETKFSKVVMTDNLDLKIISDHFSPDQAAVMALSAGTDMVLMASQASTQMALSALREAVKTKAIKKEMIIEKLLRIAKCKKENFTTYQPIYIPKIADAFHTQDAKRLLDHLQKSLSSKV